MFYEEVFFIAGILLSLYGLGFLFTLAFLIFPVLIAGQAFKNMSQGLWGMSIVSGFASVVGLALSIVNSRVSTVPAQVLVLLVFLIVTNFVFTKFRRNLMDKVINLLATHGLSKTKVRVDILSAFYKSKKSAFSI